MSDNAPVIELLDVRGMRCPMPLLKTRQALRHLASGHQLRVLTDDPGSLQDIPRWLSENGHRLLRTSMAGHAGELLIQKVD